MLENNSYDPTAEFKYNWPPSACLDPLFISFHLTPGFVSPAFSTESKKYLVDHSLIGARDYCTLRYLKKDNIKKNNIPCYFSGCLTLTLENDEVERINTVYAVDIDEECINFIRANTDYSVEVVTHALDKDARLDAASRLKLAGTILNKYKKAKYIITSRLHAAMPCLAFNTPVLLLNISPGQERFSGLKGLTHYCDRETFFAGKSNFNLKDPKENPKSYVPIRNNLIQLVTRWVSTHRNRQETGY